MKYVLHFYIIIIIIIIIAAAAAAMYETSYNMTVSQKESFPALFLWNK
jgi:hypothetical protein